MSYNINVQLLVSSEIVLTSILSILYLSYYPCGRGGREGGGEEGECEVGGRQRGVGGRQRGVGGEGRGTCTCR